DVGSPYRPHSDQQLSAIEVALSRLKNIDPIAVTAIQVHRKALVVGGGISGMQAALAVADHGYPVVLVEQTEKLGGNLEWLNRTIEDHPIAPLLDATVQKVENHPLIEIQLSTAITESFGEVGNFFTSMTDSAGTLKSIQHGTVILATGGSEAGTNAYGYGDHTAVITQKELELRLGKKEFDATDLQSVVMIQCVGSREEPRNYCSRVCCPTSLKHALKLKELNPDLAVYVLYRDMMTPGFVESYYTKLVLATGMVPKLSSRLAKLFGAHRDQDGFFQEADPKWRPVDALKEGVFACGIVLSPRSIPDAISSAQAAAQRSLKILSHERLRIGKVVATVRHSLCSRCECCLDACPYGARSLDVSNDRILVNPVMCQGCGDCATVCPNSAAVVQGFADKQVMALGPRIQGSKWKTNY
ncbi:MAG: CoB--CoM heterodisulfide reductase iron-sulfur subunit A family protein, partial [Deltaproteobacteria bacterium]|nr:CoB--CoM heterodisulfide reductase iron-sulfur subunit A family protein [Deltaproteobacteria bacterium]